MLIPFLIVAGIVAVVTKSTVGQPVRSLGEKIHARLGELLSCPLCFGWWAGLAFALASGERLMAFAYAFAYAIVSAIVVTLYRALSEAEQAIATWRWLTTPKE